MDPEFSLAHLTLLECPPAELIRIASATGYDYVSIRLTAVCEGEKAYPLIDDVAMRREVRQLLADTGLKVLDIELAQLDPRSEPEDYQKFLEVGAEIGAQHVICQMPDADRARAVDRFARLCDMAKPLGLTIDLEFPSWTQLSTLGEAVDVLNAVDKNNAGILVDTLHFARSLSSLDQLAELPEKWINFVHLCDADGQIPKTTRELVFTARCDRLFPGEGGIDIREIVEAMPMAPYSLEIPNDKLRKALGNEEFARQALHAARQYMAGCTLKGGN